MKKGAKKKNRKLRRQIRKTIGALFMASAIVVAAVPVQDVSADGENAGRAALPKKVWIWDTDISGDKPANEYTSFCESTIPSVTANETIYSSGDGKFQFAYVNPSTGGGSKVAVILNYVQDNLPNGTLEIKDSMEAFRKYRATSTDGYYCLVTQNDEFMFYDVYEQDTAIVNGTEQPLYWVNALKYVALGKGENGKYPETDDTKLIGTSYVVNHLELSGDGKYHRMYTDAEGASKEDVYEVSERMVTNQKPCYSEQRDIEGGWGTKDDTELYYQVRDSVTEDKPNGELVHPTSQEHYRINARVAYIGKQFIDNIVDPKTGIVTGWKIATNDDGTLKYRIKEEDGVFAGARGGNIANLIIGQSLSGISDYAFCGTSISSIVFGNNLTTIGNSAFKDCIRLKEVTMPEENNITALGEKAFMGCTALTSFQVPISVKAIGDSCFEGCIYLNEIELWGGSATEEPQTSWLQVIGNYAFKDCSSLSGLFLPLQYAEKDLQIAVFQGCTKLQVVRVPNKSANFADTTDGYTFDDFKKTVPGSFYFWGADTESDNRTNRSELHKTANNNEIAYKYWDRELYEVVKAETEDANSPKVIYQVNSNNELEKIWLEGKPVNVVIPSEIGPYGISTIATGCFDNACSLERVTIPKSVVTIADGAFKGSHNLGTIIFEDTTTVKEIGVDAFRTQEATCKDTITEKEPKLIIVGAMMDSEGNDTLPFAYAMQKDNMINNDKQVESWITCHSGWPTNLEVKYNYDFTTRQGGSELQSYPRYSNFLTESDAGIVPDENAITEYVKKLPYVNTSEDTKEATLTAVIKEAITKYEGNDPLQPPTEMQTQIVNASRNIVVPKNVDSLKQGIFSGYTYTTDNAGNTIQSSITGGTPDTYLNSVVLNGVSTVDPFTFTGCKNLKNVSIIGANEIGDYAFGAIEEEAVPGTINISEACESLTNVTLGGNIITTGLRPFRGCNNLTTIECLGNNLSYNGNGLLFNQSGDQKVLVQCLPGRGDIIGSVTVRAEELAGVTAIQEEAFMECNSIRNVDLTSSRIPEIPRSAFENADQLSTVIISDSVGSIEKDAFINDPLLNEITIPSSVTYIENGAFITKPKQNKIEVTCKEGTAAYRYAKAKENSSYMTVNTDVKEYYYAQFIDYPDYPDTSKEKDFPEGEGPVRVRVGEVAPTPAITPAPRNGFVFKGWLNNNPSDKAQDTIKVLPQFGASAYNVTFVDGCREDSVGIIAIQSIESGKNPDAKSLKLPDHTDKGYVFDGFTPTLEQIALDGGVTSDMTIVASYVKSTSEEKAHTVTYYDIDGKVYTTQTVGHGEAAAPVAGPVREGYTFVRWAASGDLSKVEKDIVATPVYNAGGSGGNGNGNNNGGSSDPNATRSPGSSSSPSASPSSSPEVTKYTVSVSGGSGSGRYAAGEIVAVNAYYMGEGQAFDRWTSSTAGVGFSNPNATSATFTMPAANVAITATYKTGSGTAGGTGGGSGAGTGTGGSSGGSGTTSNNGTTVEVTKPGISNTNYAGASVSGATDNFIVKVTEDQSATDAVIAALQARYGDISRIKYLPMDISLYDSTGRTRIADTTGITVNLTLPLPDDLVQYAGNNKVAAVSNGALEDLNVRFTTVGGVPCVNFTATHFSPYVIYVDTANLTEATIDTTPKTGDPIHPKWFLALGMACISLVLFFKRDKVVIKSKTA